MITSSTIVSKYSLKAMTLKSFSSKISPKQISIVDLLAVIEIFF